MANPKTSILQKEITDLGSSAFDYASRLEHDRVISSSLGILDNFAGHVTASCYSVYAISGTSADNIGIDFGAEYTRDDRVLQEVVAWAPVSGSGGVTTVDVQVQQGVGGNFSSIFTNNTFRPAVSSSLGNYGLAKASTFVSGTNMVWRNGTLMRTLLTTAAGTGVSVPGSAQKGLVVMVFWKPSGSYGA